MVSMNYLQGYIKLIFHGKKKTTMLHAQKYFPRAMFKMLPGVCTIVLSWLQSTKKIPKNDK